MNPIHKSGFASLVVLFFATGPLALAALVAFIPVIFAAVVADGLWCESHENVGH
jgi:hypothetical protein